MNDLPEQAFAQPAGAEAAQGADTSSPNTSTNFIRLSSVNRVSQARDLKLRVDDVIVAVNGAELSLDIEQLDLLMKSTTEEDMLISIYRNGHIFEVLASGSLGCSYEYARPDTVAEIAMVLPQHEIKEVGQYRQFEAMRNISRGVCLVDTRYSALAVALPPFWLIHNRMWAPFGAIMATYGVSIAVHPLFFMLVYVLVSIYFQKAQLQMLRAYYLFTEHFFWMKFAATSDRHAQEICRRFDPRASFSFSYVGEPEKNGKGNGNSLGSQTA
ncbi:MAG: hypothetical protein ACPIC4_07200 [Candidatus Puniceispirillaceae bacterium]